jgi:acyl-CoA thioester hydrolase
VAALFVGIHRRVPSGHIPAAYPAGAPLTHPAHARCVSLRVPFHDCDPLGVVWHGRYFEYFEAARCALLDSLRLDVPHVRELDLRMYVSEVRCRYNAPMSYGDEIRAWAWFSEIGPVLKVSYDLENCTTGRKCVRAFTRLALTDAAGRFLTELPESVRVRLPALGA